MDLAQVLLIMVTWSLWRDLCAHDLNGVIGDLVVTGLVLLAQWADCLVTERDRSPASQQPIPEEERDEDVSDLFGTIRLQRELEHQVSCDGPFTADGEPTGECQARSPSCDSGPELHELARALGWLVNEDGQGWDACPVHREYDQELPASVISQSKT